MKLDQFDYELPEELIAQTPLPERTGSRLLHFESGKEAFQDLQFVDLPNLLHEGDLLVLNNTEVIPARLYGKKSSGGKIEILLERMLDECTVVVQLKASKSPKVGSSLIFGNDIVAVVKDRQEEFFVLEFKDQMQFENILEQFGQTPLPPYIKRSPKKADIERYQTVYAEHKGAIAAPTAGLHFDKPMLEQLQQQGVQCAYVTLHVGAGTFQPVRVGNIKNHAIHAEQVNVSQQACDQVIECKQRSGRVIAVGTTTVRALESAASDASMNPFTGDTNLFIYPGYEFKVVDAMITNFHLPKSSLLMLVSAFAGYETTMSAYQHAVTQSYRFYSYGDAMFIS